LAGPSLHLRTKTGRRAVPSGGTLGDDRYHGGPPVGGGRCASRSRRRPPAASRWPAGQEALAKRLGLGQPSSRRSGIDDAGQPLLDPLLPARRARPGGTGERPGMRAKQPATRWWGGPTSSGPVGDLLDAGAVPGPSTAPDCDPARGFSHAAGRAAEVHLIATRQGSARRLRGSGADLHRARTGVGRRTGAASGRSGHAACRHPPGRRGSSTARYADTTASLSAYEFVNGAWQAAFPPMPARIGTRGFSDHKREGDRTTPTGLYGIGGTMYGLSPDPGVRYGYHRLVRGDYWNENARSRGYKHLPARPQPRRAERGAVAHLAPVPIFAVITYNMPVVRRTPARGSGVFLHEMVAGHTTAGCVSLSPEPTWCGC